MKDKHFIQAWLHGIAIAPVLSKVEGAKQSKSWYHQISCCPLSQFVANQHKK